jgi:hypothetical protein
VVTVGIFARRKADLTLAATDAGIRASSIDFGAGSRQATLLWRDRPPLGAAFCES